MTVRVVARRPNGNLLAFTVEGADVAAVTEQAVPNLARLAPVVPADAVWECEPWQSPRPQ